MTEPTKPPHCLNCGRALTEDQLDDVPGEMTMCLHCGVPGRLDAQLCMRPLGVEEIRGLDERTLGLIRQGQGLATLPVPKWALA